MGTGVHGMMEPQVVALFPFAITPLAPMFKISRTSSWAGTLRFSVKNQQTFCLRGHMGGCASCQWEETVPEVLGCCLPCWAQVVPALCR